MARLYVTEWVRKLDKKNMGEFLTSEGGGPRVWVANDPAAITNYAANLRAVADAIDALLASDQDEYEYALAGAPAERPERKHGKLNRNGTAAVTAADIRD